MNIAEKYDKTITGIISGTLLPVLVAFTIYLTSSSGLSVHGYLIRISETNIITHSISLCVFPNVVIFLIFNRYDMLKACRGVLAVTIGWAVIVFALKFFG
ncbi:MAG TPA: hypothetical protein VHO46_15615 [Bacteroidales bacterium]|nr:hypothetical protein [Bacteroidales bacterium]